MGERLNLVRFWRIRKELLNLETSEKCIWCGRPVFPKRITNSHGECERERKTALVLSENHLAEKLK